jgi:two-component system, NarL family, nitrate/nitrite response regulator NarL
VFEGPILPQIRIVVVDDHPMFLQGLRAAIGRATDLVLIAEGGTASEAQALATDLRPDILLLDVHLPGNGIQAARAVRTCSPGVKVIVMTGSDDDTLVAEAVAAGAVGFLTKSESVEELHRAIRTVHAGQRYIGHSLAARLVFQASQRERIEKKSTIKLSARENHVMQLITGGMTNNDISETLGLSARTVGNYVSGIYTKLGVKNRCAAILMYRRVHSSAAASVTVAG